MAEAENTPSPSAPAAAAAAPAPVSQAATPSPAQSTTPSAAPAAAAQPVVSNTPAASSAAAAPAAAAEVAPAADGAKPVDAGLLSGEPDVAPAVVEPPKEGETPPAEAPKEGEKPTESDKPADGDKPAEGEKPAEDVALPAFEAFKLPEGMQADEKAMAELTGLLGKIELAKGDHKTLQEIGQTMVETFNTKMAEALQRQTEFYVNLHEQTKATEFEALRSDPVIGGGDDKKLAAYGKEMANFLQKNGGTKEEVVAFRKLVDDRGVANALPLVKLLHNLKSKIEGYEKEKSQIIGGNKPPSEKPAPGKGIMSALYGGTRRA